MQFNDILENVDDQDKGRDCPIVDPFTGEMTTMTFRVAGPDSRTAHKARIALADELAEMADADGIVSAEHREKARLNCLARLVLSWHVTNEGDPVAFSTRNVLTLLRVRWIEEQVDAFAADRRNFRS